MPTGSDSGFSLIEVVVASAVLAGLAAAMGLFFVGGIRSTAELQRRQVATAIGAQAIELVRSVSTDADANGCVPLLNGRAQAAVTAQWAAVPAGVDLSTTDPAWTGSACSTAATVPMAGLTTPVADDGVTPAVVRDGVGYTVRTYIGTCVMPAGSGTCVRSSAVPTGSSVSTLYRVVVVVGWTGASCASSSCRYTLSTLLDTSTDPVFDLNSTTAPTAQADAVCTATGVPVLVSLLGNDSGSLGSSPVTVVTPPAHGHLSSDIVSGIGVYTPDAGFTGSDGFSYRLTSNSGVQSSVAGVVVTVGSC